jgi:hypothetical protein
LHINGAVKKIEHMTYTKNLVKNRKLRKAIDMTFGVIN